jgi:hypothetical protein
MAKGRARTAEPVERRRPGVHPAPVRDRRKAPEARSSERRLRDLEKAVIKLLLAAGLTKDARRWFGRVGRLP